MISFHMPVKLTCNVNYSKLRKLKKTFKFLISVQGLTAIKDKEIHTRILSDMEQDTEITL